MSVISLYLFRQLAQTFLILLGVLTGLVWVSQAIRFLNLVIEKGRSLSEFLLLTGYLVPTIAGLVAPTALFIATVYVLYRYNADSELVVTQAAGGSQWRLLRPFTVAAVIVTIFVILVNTIATPYGMRSFRQKLISVRTDLISTLVQEGQFVSPEAGLTVHIRSRDFGNGDLLGLLFHDTRQNEGEITYLAERARIVPDGTSTSLLMFNGTFQRRRSTAQDVDVVRFSEYTIDLDSFGPDREVEYYQASEKFMSELINPDPKDPIFIGYPGKIFAEFHDRLSSPIYPIAMMLIAFIGLASAQSNRLGRWWIILGVTGVALAVRVLGATSINLMVKTNALFPLAYLIPLLTILSALTFIYYQGRAPGLGPILARRKAELSARYSEAPLARFSNAPPYQSQPAPDSAATNRPAVRAKAAGQPSPNVPAARSPGATSAKALDAGNPPGTAVFETARPQNAAPPQVRQGTNVANKQPVRQERKSGVARASTQTRRAPPPSVAPASYEPPVKNTKPAEPQRPQLRKVAAGQTNQQIAAQNTPPSGMHPSDRDNNPVVRLLKNRAVKSPEPPRAAQDSGRNATHLIPQKQASKVTNKSPAPARPHPQSLENSKAGAPPHGRDVQNNSKADEEANPSAALRHLAKSLSADGQNQRPNQRQGQNRQPTMDPGHTAQSRGKTANPASGTPRRTGK